MELSIAHGRDVCPTQSRRYAFGPKLLAAPRADDDIGSAMHNLLWIGDDAALRQAARRPLGEDVGAAGNVDELRYPADPAYLRVVPLLEVDAWPTRQKQRCCAHLGDVRFELRGIAFAQLPCTDHGAEAAHVGEDARHGAMITDPYLDAVLDERLCDIGLDVGEPDHQIRFEPDDVIDLGTGEGRYLGLFFPGSCRS